jgi:hypothetical protein
MTINGQLIVSAYAFALGAIFGYCVRMFLG